MTLRTRNLTLALLIPCLYLMTQNNLLVSVMTSGATGIGNSARTAGFTIATAASGAGSAVAIGRWAVTGP